jgi:multidrug resistance efflux pump
MQALIKDQFVSQQDLDNAQVAYDAAAAALDSLRAQVQQMEVALAQAETNLAYSYIRAPFPGYVAERNLDLGAYVSGATAGTSTTSRGILTSMRSRRSALIEVVEKDVPLIQVGQAEVRAEVYPNRVRGHGTRGSRR